MKRTAVMNKTLDWLGDPEMGPGWLAEETSEVGERWSALFEAAMEPRELAKGGLSEFEQPLMLIELTKVFKKSMDLLQRCVEEKGEAHEALTLAATEMGSSMGLSPDGIDELWSRVFNESVCDLAYKKTTLNSWIKSCERANEMNGLSERIGWGAVERAVVESVNVLNSPDLGADRLIRSALPLVEALDKLRKITEMSHAPAEARPWMRAREVKVARAALLLCQSVANFKGSLGYDGPGSGVRKTTEKMLADTGVLRLLIDNSEAAALRSESEEMGANVKRRRVLTGG